MNRLNRQFRALGDEGGLDREIAFHVEELTAANIAAGMSQAEARRRALVEFGGQEQVKQQLREVHVSVLAEAMHANLRAAWRFIRRSPSFAAAVVLTLALGIGANSAVFSAIDAILLRPLSFPHGDELVEVHQQNLTKKSPLTFVAPARLEDWNRYNSTFQAISGYYTESISLRAGELPEKITMALVGPRFLQVWGIAPAMGRDFTSEEQKFGGPSAVLVSERFWRSHLDADPKAVGRVIKGMSATVVGVLPASFRFPDRDVDLWMPSPPDAPVAQDRTSTWFIVTGRLKQGVTLAAAQADMATVQAQLGRQFAKTDGDLTVSLEPTKAVVVGGIRSSLWVLYGSVSLLLLIACTNIAALLMARTAEREHEISIRYSLGASRVAIICQLLTEVFVLAVAGSVLGLLIAAGASHVFAMLSKDLPRVDEIGLNWRIAVYSLVCAVTATLLCGLFPAIRGTRRGLAGSLAQGGRTQVAGRSWWQPILMGVQVSLAVALLIGAGLLLRSFQAIGRVNPGFNPENVLTLRVSGGWEETADLGKLRQRINRTLDGFRNMPGVEAAATSATITGNSSEYPVELKVVEGVKDPNEKVIADIHFVSAGYFSVVQIPMLTGEGCQERQSTAVMVVVNRSFADKYFAGGPAIGYHLRSAAANDFMGSAEIRGVVGDAREEGLDKAPKPTVYWCESSPTPDPNYLVRTHGDPMAMATTLRVKVHELEPGRSVFNVMPLEDHLDDKLAENRLRTILLTLFAVTAISLVSIGLYGTISYMGRLRQREVGLRLALGALPAQITRRFLMQGLRVTLIGCAAGLMLAAGLSRLLTGMLYGISFFDPVTYAGVLTLTLLVATVASFIPALRASRVEPTEVLRET